MATLHLPKGKTYVPKAKSREISVPTRHGHAAASSFYDQFRKRPSNGQRARPPGVQSAHPSASPSALPDLFPRKQAIETAVNIVRKNLNLKPDRLAHPVSIVDQSRLKPVKPRPRLTELERARHKAAKALGSLRF